MAEDPVEQLSAAILAGIVREHGAKIAALSGVDEVSFWGCLLIDVAGLAGARIGPENIQALLSAAQSETIN